MNPAARTPPRSYRMVTEQGHHRELVVRHHPDKPYTVTVDIWVTDPETGQRRGTLRSSFDLHAVTFFECLQPLLQ